MYIYTLYKTNGHWSFTCYDLSPVPYKFQDAENTHREREREREIERERESEPGRIPVVTITTFD